MQHSGPLLLCIIDGFGLSEKTEGNAIAAANTPFYDSLLEKHPHASLRTDSEYVGLPNGQMGNSEVGHMTIGSGRIIRQSLQRITEDFDNGSLQQTATWQSLKNATNETRATHLFALVSNGGVHSHTDHVLALIKNLNTNKPVFVHAITDGRDTEPFVAKEQLKPLIEAIAPLNNVHLATVGGRFYGMDRDNRWERVQKAYDIFTQKSEAKDLQEILSAALKNDTTDEFIEPSALKISTEESACVTENDTLIFANFRADRMRQIVRSFLEPVEGLNSANIFPKNIFCMTEFDKEFNNRVSVLFPPEQPKNTLGEVVASISGKQLRIAESEKYAHVTFFLNGGREQPFEGEDRIVIPSPKVKTYDLAPKMSLETVTEKLLTANKENDYNLIVLNIANGDQVGHSGDFNACVEAVEAIDEALSQIIPAIQSKDGEAVIIADHGNCEQMLTEDGGVMTSHTLNPVPLIYVGRNAHVTSGGLADVAPTLIHLLGIKQPKEMTGKALVEVQN